MATLLRPGEPVEFNPDAGSGIGYVFRVPTVYDQMVYKRRIIGLGARLHDEGSLLRLLRRGVVAIMADSDGAAREPILDAIDAQLARREAHGLLAQATDLADAAQMRAFLASMRDLADGEAGLADVVALVTEAYPAYRQAREDNAVFTDLAGIAAAEAGLIGWTGIEPALERPSVKNGGSLPQAALARIPAAHFGPIRAFYEGLLRPTPAETKNSGSPSPSPSGPAISTAAKTRRPSCRSTATRGTSRKSAFA